MPTRVICWVVVLLISEAAVWAAEPKATLAGVPILDQDWQPFHLAWFAEAFHAANANLFVGINPQTELHLDDVVFQRIEP